MQRSKKGMIIFITMTYASYFLATVLGNETVVSVVSPFFALSVSGCFYLLFAHSQSREYRGLMLVIAIGVLGWAIGDFWGIYVQWVLWLVPEDQIFYYYIYMVPNLCFGIASILLMIKIRKHFNSLAVMVDSIVLITVWILAVTIGMFDLRFSALFEMSAIDTAMLIYLITDILVLSVVVMFASILRKSIRQQPFSIVIAGMLLYALIDISYAYQYFSGLYEPYSITDLVYMTSFLMMGVGALLAIRRDNKSQLFEIEPLQSHDIAINRGRMFVLLAAPVFLIAVRTRYTWEVLILLILVVGYERITDLLYASTADQRAINDAQRRQVLLDQEIEKQTSELVMKKNEFELLSRSDSITGLYNRRYFLSELSRRIGDGQPSVSFAVLFVDLDQFKSINDVYGHSVGDQVLIKIAERLQRILPSGTLIARQGGDEFVIGLEDSKSMEELDTMVRWIIEECNFPVQIDPFVFKIQLSIGVSIYPQDAMDAQTLLRYADIVMYQSKASGSNGYVFFNQLLNDTFHRRTQLDISLMRARFESEFCLHYQPIVTPEGKLTSMEALVRWNAPEIGWVSPVEFIPIAEENGVIIELGAWILNTAVRQIKEWNRDRSEKILMCINLSSIQLRTGDFAEKLLSLVRRHDVMPSSICLEITESVLINFDMNRSTLDKISNMGFLISVDDFGTGYASLNYIRNLQLNALKIAKPLIDEISTDPKTKDIVVALIELAHDLNLKIIAEGVATEEQLDVLTSLGCDSVQGYHFSRPLEPNQFEARYLS